MERPVSEALSVFLARSKLEEVSLSHPGDAPVRETEVDASWLKVASVQVTHLSLRRSGLSESVNDGLIDGDELVKSLVKVPGESEHKAHDAMS
jgi:hypothetical protein